MPNTDNPFGLRPVQHVSGAPYTGAARPYAILSSYATALFVGDPVVTTGAVNTAATSGPGAGTFPVGALQVINRATAGTGNPITGVIVGFAKTADQNTTYNPASTAAIALVADDPDLLFEIQAEGTVTPADIGLNGVLIYTHSGSTSTGLSGAELDCGATTALATTAAFQLKTVRFANRPDNDMAAANAKVLVMINNHSRGHATAGI